MTKNEQSFRWITSRTFWFFAALLVIGIYFFGLTIPFVGPDEPRYAQVAREMFDRGDWVTPTLGGFPWFEKPALLYWLEIAAYELFGVGEFAARTGSAIFGLCTVFSLWFLGRSCPSDERPGSLSLATWLFVIASSSLGLIVFSRGASFDIILTFPITAALVCYFAFDRSSGLPAGAQVGRSARSLAALAGFYFFIGIALIAKGLVGIVFPFAIVAFYHILIRKLPNRVLVVSLFWGTILSAAVAAIWYYPVIARNGWPFVDQFIIQHHFQRYTSNKYFHPQPFYFFLWVLPLMTLPWLPFFFAAIYSSLKRLISRTPSQATSSEHALCTRRIEMFAFAWLLVPLVFFSFSGSKLPGYILPSLPPALVLTAIYIQRSANGRPIRTAVLFSVAAVTFLVICTMLVTVVPGFADDDSVKRLIAEADEHGYSRSVVLSEHTLSHNAEFYAAGRIVRDADGKQVKLYGPDEVLEEIRKRGGEPVLVLVPNEYARQTLDSPLLSAETIARNGELTIMVARESTRHP